MKIILFALALSTGLANARPKSQAFDLRMELNMKGAQRQHPRVIVKEGEMVSILQERKGQTTFLDVTCRTQDESGILMKFVIGHVTPEGERKIISSPQVLALENELSLVQVNDEVSLSVLALKKML